MKKLYIHIAADIHTRIKMFAALRELSIREVVTQAIEEYLDKNE